MIFTADNIQITRKSVRDAVHRHDQEPIIELVRLCEACGADMIDINTGPLTRNPETDMRFFVETVQNATALPLMLDTANAKALEAGLDICRNPVYINGFSLESRKLDTILPLAVSRGVPIVGYLLNPDSSVPRNASERMDVALRLFDNAQAVGLPPENLIIDPVLVPLLWDDGSVQAMEVLDVIHALPDLLGYPVKTIVGLSNLTTGPGDPEKKQIMELAYAAMLCHAGIHMVLLNITRRSTLETLKAASLLSERGIFTWEELDVRGGRTRD